MTVCEAATAAAAAPHIRYPAQTGGGDSDVDCTNCGTGNAANRRFCLLCGAELTRGCPSCGSANEAAARFCGSCGSPLEDGATRPPVARSVAPPVADSERRLVSVLFADLVGFTTFAEGRDAEEVRALQDRYFATVTETIERYGGRVEKFIGDAVMALWGAPVAREDDAERAVRAALDLVAAVRGIRVDGEGAGAASLDARAAVMTGEAAVATGASNQGMFLESLNLAAVARADMETGLRETIDGFARVIDAVRAS